MQTKNDTLNNQAKDLEAYMKSKVKCYVVVGWMKDPDAGTVFKVYVDKRYHIDGKLIPSTWCGLPVSADEVLPPGVKPAESEDVFWDFSNQVPW